MASTLLSALDQDAYREAVFHPAHLQLLFISLPAHIFFLLSLTTIILIQLIGNPNNLPTLKGMANFQGLGLIDEDLYSPMTGNQDYWSTNVFYVRLLLLYVISRCLLVRIDTFSVRSGISYSIRLLSWEIFKLLVHIGLHRKQQVYRTVSSS